MQEPRAVTKNRKGAEPSMQRAVRAQPASPHAAHGVPGAADLPPGLRRRHSTTMPMRLMSALKIAGSKVHAASDGVQVRQLVPGS